MIDSHCHLIMNHYLVFNKCYIEIGIEKLLTIIIFESFSKVKELIKDEIIYGTIGIHPHESSSNIITTQEIIENLTKSKL